MRKFTQMNKIGIYLTHPIQYWSPILKSLASAPDVKLHVFYSRDTCTYGYYDADFNRQIKWDLPLLSGYNYSFIKSGALSKMGIPFFSHSSKDISKIIADSNFDAFILQGYSHHIDWQIAKACNRKQIPLFVRGDNTDHVSGLRPPAKTFVRDKILRKWYSHVTCGLAVADYMREHFLKYGLAKDRIFKTPHCVDNDWWQNQKSLLPKKGKAREALGLEACKFVILFCGKLMGLKNPGFILDAIRHLADPGAAGLVVVGDGQLRDEVLRGAQSCPIGKFHFAGFRNQSELPLYYQCADVLVLPSSIETWGLVVNEAMNFGVPALISDRVGCRNDLVIDGKTGFIFPYGDSIKFSSILNKLQQDPNLLGDVSSRAEKAVRAYSVQSNIDGILEALAAIGVRK